MIRAFHLALMWLTVLPLPNIKNLDDQLQAKAVYCFPLVGLCIGFILSLILLSASFFDFWLVIFCAVLFWFVITGFLHADGLADLSDGLAASHQNPDRLVEVMKDPHIGSMGVMMLVLLVIGKMLLFVSILDHHYEWALVLIPAWARLGACWWGCSLPPLTAGFAKQMFYQVDQQYLLYWLAILMILSYQFAPILLLTPLLLWAWKLFLKHRLHAVNGDALGAGIEVSELAMLFMVCLFSF
ncbi:MAG: adenosylcobinamide-GDP ribazoletransferase [Mariprofundaceae bacterium]|nr:adenosylcobinamide-GDP ribazoletransferase [Mariprofundaceae bacterium]